MTDSTNILAIPDRPFISVSKAAGGAAEISVSAISDDMMSVDMTTVVIPGECLQAVAEALLSIVAK